MSRARAWKRRLARARIVVYAGLVGLVLYAVWRYDVIRLPGSGCSPLRDYLPGDRIVVEQGRFIEVGDAVLFEAEGELFLGRVAEPPASAPAAIWEAFEGGALWILADDVGCPARDSRILGTIEREQIRGRLLVGLPW